MTECTRPIPKTTRIRLPSRPSWSSSGWQPGVEETGQGRPEQAVAAADQYYGEEHDRLLRWEADGVQPPVASGQESAGDSSGEGRRNQGDQPVAGHVHAHGYRSRDRLADRHPGSSGPSANEGPQKQEEQSGDRHGVEVEGTVRLQEVRDVRAMRAGGLPRALPRKPSPPSGKPTAPKTTSNAAAAMRVTSASARPLSRRLGSPMSTPTAAVTAPASRRSNGMWQGHLVPDAEEGPAPYAHQRDLVQRHEAEPAVEHLGAGGGHGVDRTEGQDARPVAADDRRRRATSTTATTRSATSWRGSGFVTSEHHVAVLVV